MTFKSKRTNGADMQSQCSGQRRGPGIILAILSVLFLLGTGAVRRAQAQTFTVLHSFAVDDGTGPYSGLVMDSYGNLYGTTEGGGSGAWGTVFKLEPDPASPTGYSTSVTVLHNFSGSDGGFPLGDLLLANGWLYGTTENGGTPSYCLTFITIGCGTVFRVGTSGGERVLYEFGAYHTDGINATSSLVRDSYGSLFGTTKSGGLYGTGTVFMLVYDPPTNSYTKLTLVHFGYGSSPSHPFGGLVMDSYGDFYGTTLGGGSYLKGTVFKMVTAFPLTGVLVATLHSFTGSDGALPEGRLLRDSSGNLYGTTYYGGTSTNCPGSSPGVPDGCGTVFKLDTLNVLTVLHSFSGSDGRYPTAGLVADSSGNLYGTTSGGGTSTNCPGSSNGLPEGCGVVFKLSPPRIPGNPWTETILHDFSGPDGVYPTGGLVMDPSGKYLYGTAWAGGVYFTGSSHYGFGTVFEVSTTATPQAATGEIIPKVNDLLAQGVINSGQTSSLVTKLQNAIAMINGGNINGAIGKLEAFINEVNALENSRRLTGAQGAALTTAATSVIQQLQAM